MTDATWGLIIAAAMILGVLLFWPDDGSGK